MPSAKGWLQRFDEPIPLPEGGELRTLLDASLYIEALPKEKFHRRLLGAKQTRAPKGLFAFISPRAMAHRS